ncbi:MAG: sensor histidine kinase [Streptosporangiaceae bacterium]
MSRLPRRGRPQRAPAVRVAALATLAIAAVYLAAMVFINMVAGSKLVGEVDAQLADTLSDATGKSGFTAAVLPDDADKDAASLPILLWRVSGSGRVLAASDSASRLPAGAWPRSGRSRTVQVGAVAFRVEARRTADDWLVAGQSLADIKHIQHVLLAAEAIAAPVLLAAVFLSALFIGLKASGPVEQARRRQLEFTGDASHELRTPLAVIEAETGLALSARRDPDQYVLALRRIAGESRRLRAIVDDLLWLARFDSAPANPANEPVDLITIAEICADRFSAIACSRGIDVSVRAEGDSQTCITAPPEWVDRLAGVLVDNACRYAAGSAGAPACGPAVHIVVTSHGSRVSLMVEDSGPGIPEQDRARLFDRFYRASPEGGGYGLGLAIADAIVRASGGRWRVDDSPLGGASMRVTWHRTTRRPGQRWRAGVLPETPTQTAEPSGQQA